MKKVNTHLREVLPIRWNKKTLSSAKWGEKFLPDGRIQYWIEHDLIRGVTPKMLVWWFSHLEGDMEFQGKLFNRYLVWHPEHHIHNSYAKRLPDGTVGPGATIRLVEYLNRNPKYKINVETDIEKLDEEGFIHNPRLEGILPMARMEYKFKQVGGDTFYENSLIIGWRNWSWKIFRPFIRFFLFPTARGIAWIQHNIEEVGQFEAFLPELYAKETKRGN